jgi:hypothetical protein
MGMSIKYVEAYIQITNVPINSAIITIKLPTLKPIY